MKAGNPSFNDLIPVNFFGGGGGAPKPVKVPKPEPIHMPPPPPMPKFEMPKTSSAAEIAAAMPKPIPPHRSRRRPRRAPWKRRRWLRRSCVSKVAGAVMLPHCRGEQPQEYQSTATAGGGSLLG